MLKKFLFACLHATRLLRAVAWLNRNQVTILCYHSITQRTGSSTNDPHKLHLKSEYFRRHLEYLQAHCNVVSLSEFLQARRENRRLPANTAVVTFDDGTRNFLTVAAPLLQSRQIPATVFIITGEGFTKDKGNLTAEWCADDDHSYLSWNEVKQLAGAGFEFGSHTITHSALPDLSLAEVRAELRDSLQSLRTHVAHQQIPLAYPHGRTSDLVSRLAESTGYSCALTTELGMNDDTRSLFALRRTVISADDDLATFAARLSGFTSWYERFTRFFKERPYGANEDSTCDSLVGEISGEL
jgi:peptidoglycan/xylan/chitin deacetylase (PgdA/CDA1 family)